jgi:hypothetical protein
MQNGVRLPEAGKRTMAWFKLMPDAVDRMVV